MRHVIRRAKKIYKMVAPEEGKTVLRNFTSLSVVQAINYILPVIILPYIFRIIGPGKFGLIAFAQAFVQYFVILTDYGFSVSATKEISLCHHNHCEVSRVFSAVMTVKVGLALISLILLCVIIYFIPKFRLNWPVYILSFGSVIGSTFFPVWFFQGVEKMKHIAHLNIIGGLLMVLFTFILVRHTQDYLWVPFITSATLLITGILAQRIIFTKFGVLFKFPPYADLRQQLKAGWDIFISNIAINTYTTTRVFVVGLLTDTTITGFYAIAERIANAAQTFPLYSFSQAVFPRLSKIYHKNKTLALELMRHLQRITLDTAVICLPVIYIMAEHIIRFFCGSIYYSAVLSLRLLLIAVFFVSANAFRVQFLLVCGKTHIFSRIHVLMSMVALPLIFLLVDAFGYMGAAISCIVTEAGIFLTTFLYFNRIKFTKEGGVII